MRALIRFALAACLGVGAALLISCGGSGKGLIPSGNAGPLKGDFDRVASALNSGDCAGVSDAVRRANEDLANLPPTVDPRLRRRLTEGVGNLARVAPRQCQQSTASSATTQTTATQTTPTTSTQTTTTVTTATETTPHTTSTSTTPSTPTTPDNGGGVPAPGGGSGGGAPGQ
jgi:Tfp pilus assembly major pilin PilA